MLQSHVCLNEASCTYLISTPMTYNILWFAQWCELRPQHICTDPSSRNVALNVYVRNLSVERGAKSTCWASVLSGNFGVLPFVQFCDQYIQTAIIQKANGMDTTQSTTSGKVLMKWVCEYESVMLCYIGLFGPLCSLAVAYSYSLRGYIHHETNRSICGIWLGSTRIASTNHVVYWTVSKKTVY